MLIVSALQTPPLFIEGVPIGRGRCLWPLRAANFVFQDVARSVYFCSALRLELPPG